MKVFVIVEAGHSMAGNAYRVNIVAAFRTEASAKSFIKENRWSMAPLDPNTPFYEIESKEISDGSKTVSFLRDKNVLGYMNNPTVFPKKNDALVQKIRMEYHRLQSNEYYIIDSDVDFHEVTIQ